MRSLLLIYKLLGILLILSGGFLQAQTIGIWLSHDEIMQLPMSGTAWDNVKDEADQSTGSPNLSNQDDRTNVRVLAKALVYVRTGDDSYRQDVIDACMDAIGSEGGRTLALGRELGAYVISADLVGLPPDKDAIWRQFIRDMLTHELSGKTLVSTHEERPNNWGCHAGATRAAIAVYLNDTAELERTAEVFKGWLGDRNSYSDFSYGDLSWQSDAGNPVGINPLGATINGNNVDGVLPDDQRRGGGFTWPPFQENYVYEGLQGAIVQATILHRAGYDVFNWEDQALLRAYTWLHDEINFPASGDDNWQPHLVNFYYGTNFPAPSPTTPGKNNGWTDWTHAGTNNSNPPPSIPQNVRVE